MRDTVPVDLSTNVSIYLIANIAVAFTPFLLMPILTRYLGPEGYGIVAMFMTLTTMLSAVIGLNTHSGLTARWFDRDSIDISQYVTGCVFILLSSAAFVVLSFLVLDQWLSLKLSIPVFWLFAAIIVVASSFLVQIRLVIWQVQEKAIQYGSMQLGLTFLNGLLSYVLVVLLLKDFQGRLWAHLSTFFLFGLLSLFLLYKDGFFGLRTQWRYIKDALTFGAPLIPHVLGGFFLLMADRMIVNAKLGTSNTGIYMVAVQIALGFNLINESFNKAFIPKLYALLKSGDVGEKIYLVKFTYIYFLLLLIAPLVMIFLGKYLVLFLAGAQFSDAAPILTWLILTQSFHGMYYLVTNYIFYERKTYITSSVTVVCGSISLGLTLFLVDKLGLIGACIASAIGMSLQFVFTWIMAARVHPMPWFSFMSIRKQRSGSEVTY